MTNQRGSGEGGNGASKKVQESSFGGIIKQYLDDLTDEEEKTDPDLELDLPVDEDLVSKEEKTMNYRGQVRTTTGIVRIMRESGNGESADLLEELRQTQESARQLLDQLKDLHHRRTGTYPSLPKQRSSSET